MATHPPAVRTDWDKKEGLAIRGVVMIPDVYYFTSRVFAELFNRDEMVRRAESYPGTDWPQALARTPFPGDFRLAAYHQLAEHLAAAHFQTDEEPMAYIRSKMPDPIAGDMAAWEEPQKGYATIAMLDLRIRVITDAVTATANLPQPRSAGRLILLIRALTSLRTRRAELLARIRVGENIFR